MILRESILFRLVTMPAYNGCIPITAYMIQRREIRTLLPDKWVNVKGYEDKEKAEKLYKTLVG